MSIKCIDEVPKSITDKRRSYRKQISDDIQYAINNNINKFEFEGDYNWKYLSQYAREEADNIFRRTYIDEMDTLKREHMISGYEPSRYPNYRMKGDYIKISSIKMQDRVHVYGEIDFDYVKRTCNKIIADYIENQNRMELAIKTRDVNADLTDIGLSMRSWKCLKRAGYNTVKDVLNMTFDDLCKIRNIGKHGAEEITQKLEYFREDRNVETE